jgi:hypothetical protein
MPELQRQVALLLREILPGVVFEEEVAPEWMRRPGLAEIGAGWDLVNAVYSELTGLELPESMPSRERRRLDMVLSYPDGRRRIVEFDETQHFTGARAQTLAHYDGLAVAFDVDEWRERSSARVGREPGGGFAAPKPPLFPGDGGRHRQRAFRDFLADFLPTQHDDWLPTARIHDTEAKAALRRADPGSAITALWTARAGEIE